MEATISSLEKWGYILLFFYSLGGGYVGLITAAIMSTLDKMDLYIVIVVSGVGNFVGSTMLAFLARYQKKEITSFLSKHKRKLALAQIWTRKYGSWLIIFCKYLYGIKTIVPLSIGMMNFNLKKFSFVNAIACVIWAIVVGLLGYYASGMVVKILESVDAHSYLIPLVFLALGIGFYLLLKRISQKARKTL
ncbi:DedA family protein [Helicobacter sp. MIT 05-5293]|uniref:DedA family protein n=1 Tax=Helicobacter sp. MIT 05-5293 TaxID=1548149 RepID=UPI00051D47CA|nr:DedA family protein [Helicobacter sp. MIT 05-5293]TLD79923.1 DedA family protein [Helicobacter sp. MIT 05-5293]